MTHPDHLTHIKFNRKSRLDKAINTLLGIIEGISIDGAVTDVELGLLRLWMDENAIFRDRHPYNELVPVLEEALRVGMLTQDERDDIEFLCKKFRSECYVDTVTGDMQRLHGLMTGIIADGVVTEEELRGVSEWITAHEHLKTLWPYDELESIVSSVLRDGKVNDDEQRLLRSFFTEFISLFDDRTITSPPMLQGTTLTGVCAVCPEISFEGKTFCFTGASSKFSRADFQELVVQLGGQHSNTPNKSTSYLVIGAEGNPAWAYACYGRKVESAVKLRKQGIKLIIVHENDFHDAVADAQ